MASLTADYVVVGGGLSGCAVASRLSRSGVSVVLLEAGPDATGNAAVQFFLTGASLTGSPLDYSYPTEPIPSTANRVHRLPAGKALGGGTILNFGGWLRGDASDYDEWADLVGDSRWSYAELKKWFNKTERFYDVDANGEEHGFEGPMHVTSIAAQRQYPLSETVLKAWRELGVPENLDRKGGASVGVYPMHENSDPEGARQSSNVVYPLTEAKVLTEAPVHRVIWDGKKAVGVELIDGRRVSANKEVILSAGSFQTPKILMLSGIGAASNLSKLGISPLHDSPDVGRNLHDHYALHLAFKFRDPSPGYALGSPGFNNPAFFKAIPWDWVVNQPVSSAVVSMNEPWKGRNVFEIFTAYAALGIPGIPVDGSHMAASAMLLLPASRGDVTLHSSDPRDNPRIRPNYISTECDRAALIQAVKTIIKLMTTTDSLKPIIEVESPPVIEGLTDGMKPLTTSSSDEEILERLAKTGEQHQHSGGTASMGKVVDTEGKVVGVESLRVVDASIIPVPLGGHPQATLYAMAEQMASIILTCA
jgi:choline dehydrogenase-like flavoprotein